MEQKKPISHTVAGVLVAAFLIAYSVFINAAAAGSSPQSGGITYAVIILAIVFFVNHYGRSVGYTASFKQLFRYGAKTTATLTAIFVLFLILLSFISPELKRQVLEATETSLETQKGMKPEEKTQMLEGLRRYYWPLIIGVTMFFFALVGAVGSLIGAAVTKKLPPGSNTSYQD